MNTVTRIIMGSVFAVILFCQPVSAKTASTNSDPGSAPLTDLHPLRPGLAPDKGISVVTGSSVDIANGTYTFTETDLRVPAKGIPITMERSYRSNQIMKGRDDKDWQFASPMESPLGFGWYSPWFARVGTDGSYLDGQGNFMYFERDANGTYLSDPNNGLILRRSGSGFEVFKRGEDIVQHFDQSGQLTRMTDSGGNSVTLDYGPDGKLATIRDVIGRTVLTFGYDGNYVSRITDLAGRTIRYGHDSFGNLTSSDLDLPGGQTIRLGSYDYDTNSYPTPPLSCRYKEWYSDGIKYVEASCYSDQSQNTYHGLINKTDVGGNSHTIAYNTKWRNKGIAQSVTDPQGRSTTFTYDFGNRVFYYTDYNGRKYKKVLNDKGQMVQLSEITGTTNNNTNIGSGSGTMVYDPNAAYKGGTETVITKIEYFDNRTTKTTDALGNATSEQKDEWGNTIKRTDADGFEWRSQYDATGRQIMAIDPLGTTTRYEYDASGNRTKEIQAAGTPDESITSYTYNRYRELLTTTNNGSPTTYAYDDGGNLTTITDPEQNNTSMSYDPAGNLTSRSVPLIGATTYSDHDWKGNPKNITDPNGTTTTNSYDIAGRILTTTTDSATTTYSYTLTGGACTSCSASSSTDNDKIANIILPEGNRIDYGYDTNGNLATITDNDGNRIVYTYDAKGNKIKEEIKDSTGALQKTQSIQYDILNRRNKTINPDLGEATNSYDKRGNRIALTNPNNAITSYSYDQANRLIKVTQSGDVTISYTYDRRNNLTSVTDANGNTTTYEYDKQNRLTKTTSPDTGITSYSYDKNGNLKTKTDAKGVVANYTYDTANRLTAISFPDPQDNIGYAYDTCVNGKGRLCTMQDQSGTTTYEYTTKGQIKKETRSIGTTTFITEYGYDKNGNVTSMKYPSGRVIIYNYANDKVTGVLNNGIQIAVNIGYKPFGGLSALTFGNGIQQANTYDQQYRLTNLTANSIQDLGYGYDKNGNITAITDNLDATKTKVYGYDALDRLASAQGPWGTLGYSYDKVGNRKTENHNDVTTSYGYKANSTQLISVSGEKNYSFGFDVNGNTNTENSRQYIYNQNQRLIKVAEQTTTKDEQGQDVTTTATKGEYIYNGSGQRAKKATAAGTTYFVFDQQGKLIEESGATSADYVFLNGSPYAKIENTTVYYIHTDHLGTPQKMTSGQKQLAWEVQAMPFGETLNITGQATNNLRFPGQWYDEEAGLNYNYFRDYKANIGRYIQADPIGIDKGNNHLFLYVQSNPLSKTDYMGLFCGSGRNNKYIPDRVGSIDFANACAGHDDCYGKCGSPKSMCDFNFHKDMSKECRKFIFNPILFLECQILADAYYAAVAFLGDIPYKDAQKNCKCKK